MISLLFAFFTSAQALPARQPRVIYGDDGRLDYYALLSSQKQWADATALLVRSISLDTRNGVAHLDLKPWGYGLCADEPFVNQLAVGFCSGFLLAPDILITAGHCVSNASACADLRVVFGFQVRQQGVQPQDLNLEQVYRCKEVIASRQEYGHADFSVLRLDRPVEGAEPLVPERERAPNSGQAVAAIGYPEGLPMKFAGGAAIRSVQADIFVANTDTYGGNSGSAVIDATTGHVLGVLVRGERDFAWDYKENCNRSTHCSENACRGEDVTRIEQVLPYLR